MANMENKRKSRKVMRGSFTRAANELDALCMDVVSDIEKIEIIWVLCKEKYDELRVLDSEIYDSLLESATEDKLDSEITSKDEYGMKFTAVRLKYDKIHDDLSGSVYHAATHTSNGQKTESPGSSGMRKFKLPEIEFKNYDGAQFKKVHEDNAIDANDKIEYLIQATVPGSRARLLVESYPAMGENYHKIIDSMQSRFGREDLQIEVYVRGLLKIILINSASKQRFDVATLYDQIETQLRALETLGITSDKYMTLKF